MPGRLGSAISEYMIEYPSKWRVSSLTAEAFSTCAPSRLTLGVPPLLMESRNVFFASSLK